MRDRRHSEALVGAALFLALWGGHLAMWAWAWREFYARDILRPFGWKGNWLVYGVYGMLYLAFSRLYGGWRVGYLKKWDLAVSGALTVALTDVVTYLQVCLVGRGLMPFTPFVGLALAQMVTLGVWVVACAGLRARAFPPRRALLVAGDAVIAQTLAGKMASRPDRFLVVGTVGTEGATEALSRGLPAGLDAAVLCGLGSEVRDRLLKLCFDRGLRAYVTPGVADVLVRGACDVTTFDAPLLLSQEPGLTPGQAFLKRALDLALAVPGVLILSPLMLAITITVKIGDGGPVLFRQGRCTLGNRVFSIMKFRTLVEGAGEAPVADHDPRVTQVGRLLRASRLDELPQLFNVIKGDMSLVGPRPETVAHVEAYTRDFPEFAFRAKAKAGLTGYAQVVGKYNTSARDKLLMDLMYITNWSLLGDVKLILMTLKVLFFRESTEGFKKLSTKGAMAVAGQYDGRAK